LLDLSGGFVNQILKDDASGKSFSSCFVEDKPTWLQLEKELFDSGIRLPLFHRWAWAECGRKGKNYLVVVRDGDGRLLGAAAVRVDASRVLPGHRFLRVYRFGDALPETGWEPLIAALKNQAVADAGVLRLSVGVFSRDRRGEIASVLERYGFQKLSQSHSYRHTLALELRPSEEEVLAGLHKTARKNLREAEKVQLCVRPLTEAIYAERIDALQREAMSRTGGHAEALDAAAILELSRLYPHLSRVVGLFLSASDLQPEGLVGFAWGCMHGDHGEYRAAGTMRLPDRNIAISYPLLWELIVWARREGATWFDLGGVTLADSGTDPLGGISNFKRYFSRNVEEVGEEWILEPHPARARLATLLGRIARNITG
jgi:CelD/BcsL family acetyltransferase involved in cellulose biosynthesis